VDQAGLKAHGESPEFGAFTKKLGEAGMAKAKIDLKFVKPAGGFTSRL